MPIATLTSKGQITLPISVRNTLGLSAGSKVDFFPVDGSFVLCRSAATFLRLKGGLQLYGPQYYGAFVHDLDGHKIEATFWDEAAG